MGLAIAERTGATGQDLLGAMILGYEAAGRIGEARSGGRGGVHASQIVAFAGATAAAKLLKLTDEQMAHALGIVAITMGGLATGTNSWAREYMGANAAACGVNAALAASRGYTVNEDMLGSRGGFVDVFGGGAKAVERLTADLGKEWDIVDFLAIKLWPGAHPFSGTVEAAMNAARQANVAARRGREDSRRRPEPDDAFRGAGGPATWPTPFTACRTTSRRPSPTRTSPGSMRPRRSSRDPRITRLMDLVDVDPAPPPVKYTWSWGGTVTIVTSSGTRFTSTVDAPRGSGPRGIEWSDVEAKYRALMPESKLAGRRIDDVLALIHGFERVKNVSELTRLLAPGR